MRNPDDRNIERSLRTERPEPRREFLEAMEAAISSRPGRHARRARLVVACAATAALLAAAGALGGFGYAASAIEDAASGISDTLTGAGGASSGDSSISGAPTPASDQYGNPLPEATAAPTVTATSEPVVDCTNGQGTITLQIFLTQPSHLEVTMTGVTLSGTTSADVAAGTVTVTIVLPSCDVPADASITVTATNQFGSSTVDVPVQS